MRVWTLHPRYLDAQGLVALWREALLAQKVLRGETKGYLNHPQLTRFRASEKPVAAIASYLQGVANEASIRGYSFDKSKIGEGELCASIDETEGQLMYEWQHLKNKLAERNPANLHAMDGIAVPQAHPLFNIVRGGVRDWEKR